MGRSFAVLMVHQKPYASPEQLVERLKSRGMAFDDDGRALSRLKKIGYYRLAAYWYPFRWDTVLGKHAGDHFLPGTSFEECHQFYVFDKDLRSFLADPLERIEIAFRARLSDVIGSRDAVGHRGTGMLHWPKKKGRFSHEDWLRKQDREFSYSTADFADHFRKKYASFHPPIWIAKEVWTFGIMSHLLNGLKGTFRDEMADFFNCPRGPYIGSWTKSLNPLRNDCAHHARVWNRNYSLEPLIPPQGRVTELDHLHQIGTHSQRLYSLAAILFYLCKQAYPGTRLASNFRLLITTQAPRDRLIDPVRAGFPVGWQDLPLWN